MKARHNAAWIDLETTGTDETAGSILEVGVVIATADGEILDEAEWLVAPDPAHLAALDPVVYEMHRTSGLLADLEAAGPAVCDLDYVDRDLGRLLHTYAVRGQVILAGSGVSHFDARWIRRHLPAANRRLTWWAWDVGVVRRFLSTVNPSLVRPSPEKAHRGLADARDHLAEWNHYRTTVARLADG